MILYISVYPRLVYLHYLTSTFIYRRC